MIHSSKITQHVLVFGLVEGTPWQWSQSRRLQSCGIWLLAYHDDSINKNDSFKSGSMHPSTLFWLVSSRADTLVAVLATASMTPDIAGMVCSGLLIFVKSWWQDGCWVHKYGFTCVFVICVYCILRYCIQYVQYLLYSFYGLLSCQCICHTPSFYSKCQPLQAERKFNILSSLCLTPASPPGKSWTVVISKNSRWVIYLLVPGIICSLHRAKTSVLERILFHAFSSDSWEIVTSSNSLGIIHWEIQFAPLKGFEVQVHHKWKRHSRKLEQSTQLHPPELQFSTPKTTMELIGIGM